MAYYPSLIEKMIASFSKFPGVGRRSAERITFWLLTQKREDAEELAQNIINLKEGMTFCRKCKNFSDQDICMICRDEQRDQSVICVVENPKDVLAIEKTGSYRGLYHVLLGNISPSEGRGPEHLQIQQLFNRLKSESIKEIVIATDPDNEGEMTALYLIKQLKVYPLKVSRIGMGLPVGGAVEYSDMSSLSAALDARREV